MDGSDGSVVRHAERRPKIMMIRCNILCNPRNGYGGMRRIWNSRKKISCLRVLEIICLLFSLLNIAIRKIDRTPEEIKMYTGINIRQVQETRFRQLFSHHCLLRFANKIITFSLTSTSNIRDQLA